MPALLPVQKTASSPLCRNDLVVVRPYSVAIRLSMADRVAGLEKSVPAIRRGNRVGAATGQLRTDSTSSFCPGYWSCYADTFGQDVLLIKVLRAHTADEIMIHIRTLLSDH
jgi:hypothetical protein